MDYDYILWCKKGWSRVGGRMDKLREMPVCDEIIAQDEKDHADAQKAGRTDKKRLTAEEVMSRAGIKFMAQVKRRYVYYVFRSLEAIWAIYNSFVWNQKYWYLQLEFAEAYPPEWDPKKPKASRGVYLPDTQWLYLPVEALPVRPYVCPSFPVQSQQAVPRSQPQPQPQPQSRQSQPPPLLRSNIPGLVDDSRIIREGREYTPYVPLLQTDPKPLGTAATKALTCTTPTATTLTTTSTTTVSSVEFELVSPGNGEVAQVSMEDCEQQTSLPPPLPFIPTAQNMMALHPAPASPAQQQIPLPTKNPLLQGLSKVLTQGRLVPSSFQCTGYTPYVPADPKQLCPSVTKSTISTSSTALTSSAETSAVLQDAVSQASSSDDDSNENENDAAYDSDEPTANNAKVSTETHMAVCDSAVPLSQTTTTTTSAELMKVPIPFGVHVLNSAEIILEKEIGSGGFSTVFSARGANIKMAVKVIQVTDFLAVSAIYKELEILQEAQQQNNIIHLIGACPAPDKKSFWIVTELAMTDLHKLIHSQGTCLSPSDWMWLLIGAAHGVRILHHLRIVHCDLKPSNILVSEDITAKLADMGLSKRLLKGLDMCLPIDHFEGTANYAAPELSLPLSTGLYEGATTAADIFSFGSIIYEVMMRCIPFNELESDQVHTAIARDDQLDLEALNGPTQEPPRPLLGSLITGCRFATPGDRLNIDDVIRNLGEARFVYMVPTEEARQFWQYEVSAPLPRDHKIVDVSWEQLVAVLRRKIPDEATIYELKCALERRGRVSLQRFSDNWDKLARYT
ncbi:Protein kinase domain [Pelomyxa schiedti]|nr:Protein kinase domain [Pelomyxa schiedti]